MKDPFNVWTALRERFCAPAWAYLEEVRNGTGNSAVTRTADALAMSTWPSRGLELVGIEVKVSRSDWLREKDDPAKSAEIQQYCDRWYLAVSDAEIVKPGELPKTWGLLAPRGGKLVAAVEAPLLKPKPLDRRFVASILRKVTDGFVPASKVTELAADRVTRNRTEERERYEKTLAAKERDHDRLRASVKAFEEASGVRLDAYDFNNRRIGEAVKCVLEFGRDPKVMHANLLGELERVERAAARASEFAREVRTSLAAELAEPREVSFEDCQNVHCPVGCPKSHALVAVEYASGSAS